MSRQTFIAKSAKSYLREHDKSLVIFRCVSLLLFVNIISSTRVEKYLCFSYVYVAICAHTWFYFIDITFLIQKVKAHCSLVLQQNAVHCYINYFRAQNISFAFLVKTPAVTDMLNLFVLRDPDLKEYILLSLVPLFSGCELLFCMYLWVFFFLVYNKIQHYQYPSEEAFKFWINVDTLFSYLITDLPLGKKAQEWNNESKIFPTISYFTDHSQLPLF